MDILRKDFSIHYRATSLWNQTLSKVQLCSTINETKTFGQRFAAASSQEEFYVLAINHSAKDFDICYCFFFSFIDLLKTTKSFFKEAKVFNIWAIQRCWWINNFIIT